MQRCIMHVDMDAFFASVEQRDEPSYRGRPLIVGGQGSRGVVSTASYEARRYGVHSAMSMAEARRRCPQGIFVPGRYEVYKQVSGQLQEVFHEFAPVVEPLSLDEAFLDLTGVVELESGAKAYAENIKAAVWRKTALIASVGVAPNKFLAKLASDMQKPDGLLIIKSQDVTALLENLPLRRLWGIGRKMESRLKELGIDTVGKLAKADPHKLARHCGSMAYQLIEQANGRDRREVEGERKIQSIGNEITFEQDLLAAEQIEPQLLRLAEQVGSRVRAAGLSARTITLKVRFADFSTITRSRTTVETISFDEDIYSCVRELYRREEIMQGVRLLGVTASALQQGVQQSLFVSAAEIKKQRLYKTMDELNKKFGRGTVSRARTSNKKGSALAADPK